MSVMQRQESFNRFYQEFVIDEAPRCVEGGSSADSGICVYRNEEGHGCAIGIQPEFQEIYSDRYEEQDIETLYCSYPEVNDIIAFQDLKYFVQLQHLHDNTLDQVGPEMFMKELRKVATEWDVTIPGEVG